jgi:hypothetical protein
VKILQHYPEHGFGRVLVWEGSLGASLPGGLTLCRSREGNLCLTYRAERCEWTVLLSTREEKGLHEFLENSGPKDGSASGEATADPESHSLSA